MKKLFLVLAAIGMIKATAIAQTQLTNRTNSRPHNRADTTKAQNKSNFAPTDADRNNPTNNTNPNPNNGVNTSTPNQVNPTNPNTNNPNNPNINNNVR